MRFVEVMEKGFVSDAHMKEYETSCLYAKMEPVVTSGIMNASYFLWFVSLYFPEWTYVLFATRKQQWAFSQGWFLNVLHLLLPLGMHTTNIVTKSPTVLYLVLVSLKWSHRSPSCYWRCSCSSRNPPPSPCGWRSFRCWTRSSAHQSSPGWASRYCLTGRKRHRLKKLQSRLAEVGEEHEDSLWSKQCVGIHEN